jgi:hypothetical protein
MNRCRIRTFTTLAIVKVTYAITSKCMSRHGSLALSSQPPFNKRWIYDNGTSSNGINNNFRS